MPPVPASSAFFRLNRDTGPPYLWAPRLAEEGVALHAFSTRLGGCSAGPLASLNTAFHNGDSADNVLENRRRFFSLFGLDYRLTVSTVQVHGSAVAEVGPQQMGEGALPGSAVQRADAMVTTTPGVIMAAYAADCQLIFFLSRRKPLAALVHAGRQGALGRIAAHTVRYLVDRHGVDPGRLLAALAPVICRRCYSIDRETAGEFRAAGWENEACLAPAGDDLFALDLEAVNVAQLRQTGIRAENITTSNLCTSCRPDLFYSYRRDRGRTGRMLGFLALR